MVASEPERCEERSAEDRLGSWKAIAAYLKRDVTTVQRWERREGVPVHRHVHETRGCVYAFSAELDAWLKNRRPPRMANLAVHLAGGPGWPQRALSSPLRLSLHCSSKLVTLGHARTAWLPSVACELLRVPRGGPPEDNRASERTRCVSQSRIGGCPTRQTPPDEPARRGGPGSIEERSDALVVLIGWLSRMIQLQLQDDSAVEDDSHYPRPKLYQPIEERYLELAGILRVVSHRIQERTA